MLSRELQIGKAAEHLVAFDLIMKGHNAFLADQGLPFDVVVVSDAGALLRVQVKATSKPSDLVRNGARSPYRFGIRRGRGALSAVSASEADVIAFVALDARAVAYMPVALLLSRKHEGIVLCIDLYLTREDARARRLYASGKQRESYARSFEDYPDLSAGSVYGHSG